jgi:hypothetical protein
MEYGNRQQRKSTLYAGIVAVWLTFCLLIIVPNDVKENWVHMLGQPKAEL